MENQSDRVREHVLQLMQRKDKIEGEIKELTSILTKNGVGMSDPLVDNEGFPINSVDIYQVRHARHRIICLQNDHIKLMKQIERGLEGYYSASSDTDVSTPCPMEIDRQETVVHKTPFAKVNLVSPQSPAEYAGIASDDEIVEFGSVNSTNFKNIADLAAVVQHSEGDKVSLKIKRGDRYLTVDLRPKKWTGRGLVGCNFVSL